MASRNAGGGSQGLGRQSSVATSGSVMKSRQLVSFVLESLLFCALLFLFFCSSFLFPLPFLEPWLVGSQTEQYVYRHIYILSWPSCQKTYQIPRIY